MPVTLNDLTKAGLILLVEVLLKELAVPMPEKSIARFVIGERLHRSHAEFKSYEKKASALKKIKTVKAMNKIIDQANAHGKRSNSLYGSALKLAEEYGLVDIFFKEEKGDDHEPE